MVLFLMFFIFSVFGMDPYSQGYSDNINHFYLFSNPSTYGIRDISFSASYADVKHDYGFMRKYRDQNFILFYPSTFQGKNITLMFNYNRNDFKNFNLDFKKIGFGTYHAFETEDSYMDVGFSLKRASSFKEYKSRYLYDLSLLIRKDQYLSGLSFENINGGYGSYRDGIPENKSFYISRFISDYIIGSSISHTRFEDKSSVMLSLSASQIIRTYRYGYFRISTSMGFSSDIKKLSFGIFYNTDMWEFSWAISGMLNAPNYINSSVGITIYWGREDVESEYEKIIKREVKYRKDLLKELSDAAEREAKLKKNISQLSAQTDELKYKIEMIEKELEMERKNKEKLISEKEKAQSILNSIIEKQKKEKQELENIERKRKEEKTKLLQKEFDTEMERYRKLKLENSSKTVLINYLRKIISEYQDSGIDISEATLELMSLTKK